MISDSATTEALEFPNSIGIEPGSIYHTRIEIETEREEFDPTKVLDDAHNLMLYKIWERASPGTFKSSAKAELEKNDSVKVVMERSGLLLDYYIYCMEYMFSVRRWVPKGVRR